MTKRILAILLALFMLIPCIVACGDNDKQDKESGDIVDTDDYEGTDKYEVYDDLGDLDFGGKVVSIANVDRTWYDHEVFVEKITGDTVKDAIYKRNAAVEKRLNIEIMPVRFRGPGVVQFAVVNDLQKNILGGTLSYDLIHNPSYATASYTSRSLFYNLLKVDALDLDKVYWSKYFNDAASIGNGQYMATGAISLSFYRFIFATLVNNKVLESHADSPDLVEVLRQGKWTLEYQKQLASQYYVDKGEPGKDEQDDFGLVTSDYLNVDPYWSSCDITVLKKTSNGFYTYDLDIERVSIVVDRVLSMFNDNGTFCYLLDGKHETGNGEQIEIANKFAQGGALMATLRLIELEDISIRNMLDEYTVLPMPKYDENQDDYYSYIHDSFTAVSIPASVNDEEAEVLGAVLEAMASESYRTVTPAYYETALKLRYVDNPESSEILDMMTQNVKLDAAVVYMHALVADNSTVLTILRKISVDNYRSGISPNVGSSFASFSGAIGKKLNSVQAAIMQMQKKGN